MLMLRRPLYLTPLLLLALLPACERGTNPAPTAPDVQAPLAPAQAPDAVSLQDVVETRPDYIVGISFPQSAAKHPGLAQALRTYADAARGDLMQAVAGLSGQKPTAPYDLSLQFTGLVETPDVVAVAADGSSYTGGAHGNPLVARFVWLPKTQQMLTAQALFPAKNAWQVISDTSRELLVTTLSQRLDTDEMEGAERVRQLQKIRDDAASRLRRLHVEVELVVCRREIDSRIHAALFAVAARDVQNGIDVERRGFRMDRALGR